MQLLMVVTAERHREFVADFASEGSRFGELQVVRITGQAPADQAGLRRDESQMGLVSPSRRFAQWIDHGFSVLVVGIRCDRRQRNSTAISTGRRRGPGFGRTIWRLRELICAEIQGAKDDLTSGFHSTGVVCRERILGRQASPRP